MSKSFAEFSLGFFPRVSLMCLHAIMRNFSAFVRDFRACFAVARELEPVDRP
jgi:hypothetical protein